MYKYLVVEEGEGEGCDYSIGCNQRWNVIDSHLPLEEFKKKAIAFAIFGGDANGNLETHGMSDENIVSDLRIVQLDNTTLHFVDMYEEREKLELESTNRIEEENKELRRRQYEKLRSEFGENT